MAAFCISFSRYAPARYALFGYYLAGPFFLAFQFTHGVTETLPFLGWLTYTERGGLTLVFVFALAVVILGSKLRPRSVAFPLAVFGILLMLGEAWTFRPAFRNRPVEAALPSEDAAMAVADESLPNVYHLLLDGFQTDMLSPYLSAEIEESLGGFTFFPNNEGGVSHDLDLSRFDVQRKALCIRSGQVGVPGGISKRRVVSFSSLERRRLRNDRLHSGSPGNADRSRGLPRSPGGSRTGKPWSQ